MENIDLHTDRYEEEKDTIIILNEMSEVPGKIYRAKMFLDKETNDSILSFPQELVNEIDDPAVSISVVDENVIVKIVSNSDSSVSSKEYELFKYDKDVNPEEFDRISNVFDEIESKLNV